MVRTCPIPALPLRDQTWPPQYPRIPCSTTLFSGPGESTGQSRTNSGHNYFVRSLGLHGIDLEEESLEMLRVAGQELKALNLAYYGSQRPILYQLLSIWPNIQFLKIGSTMSISLPWGNDASSQPKSNADNAGEVAQRNGAKICLHDLVLTFLLPPAVVAWLLASSTDSLRTIELRESPCLMEKRILTDVLVPHAPRLRSLRLWFYNDDSAALLRMCTSLEELVLYGLELPPRCPLAPNLPPTIKHLSFGVWGYNYRITTLQPIIEAVDALPNLKVLTCNRNVRRQQYDNFAILEWKCRMKGAEVVLSDAPAENWDYLSAVNGFSEEGRRTAERKSRTRDEKYWQQLVERSTT